MTSRIAILLVLGMLGAAGCNASGGSAVPPAPSYVSELRPEQRGLAFAEARCAACHAVGPGISPNPQAPTFEDVINTPGLELATLESWLRRSHDFPAMMNFTIDPEQVDDLAAYMLTLKKPGYRPDIE